MGFLSPAFLLLGVAAAVPLLVHLLQRHQGPRVVFPALRYLRRAERENARRIRVRQLLLMLLRIAALLFLALAAARPYVRLGGSGHHPTAAVIVLDNSLSSGAIVAGRRTLDELKARALDVLADAGPDDRFWLVKAAQPWDAATAGDAATIAARVRETTVSASAGDVSAAIERGRGLLAGGAERRSPEIELLSDLQATAFRGPAGVRGPPVVVWAPAAPPPRNAGVTSVLLGGGFAPRAGERTTVVVRVEGARDSVPVRLRVDGRVAAAALARPGADLTMSLSAPSRRALVGNVEIEPDALRGDDRRYFAAAVRAAPRVSLARPAPFVEEALTVLSGAARIALRGSAAPTAPGAAGAAGAASTPRASTPGAASAPGAISTPFAAEGGETVVAPAAVGADAVARGAAVVVLPPDSAVELPAANRRLAAAGIPWRYAAAQANGEARFAPTSADPELASALRDARVRLIYPLGGEGAGARDDSVLVRLSSGEPWLVRGRAPGGGIYLVAASPLNGSATTLPTSAALIPLLDRMLGPWTATGTPAREVTVGDAVTLPDAASAVAPIGGAPLPVEGGAPYRPLEPGVYRVLAADSTLDLLVANPPPAETPLARIDRAALERRLSGEAVHFAGDRRAWRRSIFRDRLGYQLWPALLVAALIALLAEALLAASGRAAGAPRVKSAPNIART